MALQGRLKDFPIGNIFQMIFMEKKAGILLVREGDASVQVSFEKGKILFAEHGGAIDERRLKSGLVRNGYLTADQWGKIKEECASTLKPLLPVLYRQVGKDIFDFFIQRQIQHALFNVLQWKEGEYVFKPNAEPEIDRNLYKTMEGEFMVMESFRVIDEWKELKKSLPPVKSKLKASPNQEKLLEDPGLELSEDEEKVVNLVKDPLSIEEIIDSSLDDECTTAKGISQLLEKGLLVTVEDEAKKQKTAVKQTSKGWTGKGIAVALLLLLGLGAGSYWRYEGFKRGWRANWDLLLPIQEIGARKGLERVNNSLYHYYAMKGIMPSGVGELVKEGLLPDGESRDPWNRAYMLESAEGTYKLYSRGPAPNNPSDDIYWTR